MKDKVAACVHGGRFSNLERSEKIFKDIYVDI